MFDIKIMCIFASEFVTKQSSKNEIASGYFYALTANRLGRSNLCSCCSHVTVAWSQIRGERPFFRSIIFHEQMTKQMKNCKDAKHSNVITASTHETGTITLTLTGVRNPYLYAIRKSFKEFLEEETHGSISSDLRLNSKIAAARLLFPESRALLKSKTVKI